MRASWSAQPASAKRGLWPGPVWLKVRVRITQSPYLLPYTSPAAALRINCDVRRQLTIERAERLVVFLGAGERDVIGAVQLLVRILGQLVREVASHEGRDAGDERAQGLSEPSSTPEDHAAWSRR